ncbi:hypothetical protein LSUE1_G004886 [Lachnellula suecica]|uniref:Ubiquitin 3 binding protein But2 C-terminal domain-containing protein n=1 Tax=Lachnellula suecica TaxID=602035 RepID=A0A8T9CCL3_9HELO|nr:hypothetical protein LSUE1_G004886 [Lachnellula suecica]
MLSRPTILLSALAAFTSALPVDQALEPRVCGTINLPSTQISLQQAAPDTSFSNTAAGDLSISLSQSVSNTGQVINKVSSLIGFTTPPSGSYGCTLGITFPSNNPFTNLSGVSPTLDVYTVPSLPAGAPTWNNVQKGSLFGTVTVAAGQSTTINSESCGSGLNFVIEYAGWVTGAGSVGWTEYINALNGAGLRGVFLNFNC